MAADELDGIGADPGSATVDVVLLSWRNSDKTVTALQALAAAQTTGTRVLVVDNGSDEGSDERVWCELRRLWPDAVRVEQPEDHVDAARLAGRLAAATDAACLPAHARQRAIFVRSMRNRGYAGGMNVGLALAAEHAPGEFFWLLCNDVVAQPGAIEALVRRCRQDGRIALCGATQLIDADADAETARTIPGGMRYRAALGWDVPVAFTGSAEADRARVERRMNCVQGSAVFGTRRFLCAVGPLLTDRFLYFEEAEWAHRARQAGFRLAWAPEAIVHNQHAATMQPAASANGAGDTTLQRARHELVHYLLARGAVVYTRRFHPRLLPFVVAARLCRSVEEGVRKGPSVGRHSVQGLLDGLQGRHRRFALLGNALLPLDVRIIDVRFPAATELATT